MTILYEGSNSFILTTPGIVVNEERETASKWAAQHIQHNEAIKWILANYVEADRPNRNNQMWTLASLQMSKPTIVNSPMNIMHHQDYIVGTWTAAEMIYPLGENEEEVAELTNPYIETLGAFWKYYFPEELDAIERAYAIGKLAVSMECVGKSLTCAGESGCGEEFAYAGPAHESYCEHINTGSSAKQINDPHFLGGGLILPPARPGWADANVQEISKRLFDDVSSEKLNELYESVQTEMSELDEEETEHQMAEIIHRDKKSAERLGRDYVSRWKDDKKFKRNKK